MPELHLYYSTSHRESMEYGPITALGSWSRSREKIRDRIRYKTWRPSPSDKLWSTRHWTRREESSIDTLQGRAALWTLGFSLQNHDTIQFYCSKPQLTIIPSHHVLVHKMSRNVDFRPQSLRHIKDRAASSRSRIYWWNPVSLSSPWMSWSLT